MLDYEFMRIAFVTAILLGIALPLVGSGAVFKRLSSSGDALAHSSLAGVAIGLVAGLNPLWMSIVSCVVSFFVIELLRKKFHKYSEIGVTVVLAASIGLAGILSGFVKAANFDAYLFGSILLISQTEFFLTIGLTVVVVVFSLLFYPQIFASLYSSEESKVQGIKVGLLTFGQDLLLSVTIAIAAKAVGSLVVSCLVVLPTAISLQLLKGYRFTIISSIFFSVVSMVLGLVISYYLELKPGATIVMVAIFFFLLALLYRLIRQRVKTKRR